MKIGFNKSKLFSSISSKKYLIILCLSLVLFSWIQATPTLMDPDSFYHAKMALFLKGGEIIKDLPWFQATTLKENFTDQHFLYHIILVPFVSFFDPLIGIKIAQVIFASLATLSIYWFLEKYRIKGAFFYTLLLFTSYFFIFRLNLVKAPALSLIILVFALYFIFKRRYIWIFLLSIFYVWTYGGWPILLIITVLFLIAETFSYLNSNKEAADNLLKNSKIKSLYFFCLLVIKNFLKKDSLKLFFSVLGGIIFGLVISPYFPHNLSFYWVQIFKIGVVNFQNTIGVGGEWYPSYSFVVIPETFLVFFLWIFSFGWFFIQIKKQGKEAVTLGLLSILFFFLSLKSRRYLEYFVPVALLASSFFLNNFWSMIEWKNYYQQFKKLFLPPYGFLSVFIYFWFIIFLLFFVQNNLGKILSLRGDFENGLPFSYFQRASNYLKENTPPGSIIFHDMWDESPMLFYYNDHNYYINGLDQTFMYLYSPDLYRLWEQIVNGDIKGESLATAIKNEFQAPYVLIAKVDRSEKMRDNIKEDNYFEKIYEDEEAIIYKINL
jgi:hypothetical protein